MRVGSIASVIVAIISTGGAFGGYMYFKPKDLNAYLQWKGYSLVKEDDSNFWKAIYVENEEAFERDFGIVKEEKTDKWKVIKEYCIKALKKQDYTRDVDKAIKYCVDEIKTVKGQLVRDQKELKDLMNDKAQFKVATAVQGNADFWALLKVPNGTFDDKIKAYEDWCKESLNAKPTKGLVGNVDTFCRKKNYSNFKGKLASDGYERISKEEIKARYTKFDVANLSESKTSRYVIEIMGGEKGWESIFKGEGAAKKIEQQKFEDRYTFYCAQMDNIKIETENYSDNYSKYLGICAIKTEEKTT